MKSTLLTFIFVLAKFTAAQTDLPINTTLTDLYTHEVDPLEERDWLPLSTGLMMERSHSESEARSLLKRAATARESGSPVTRDLNQTPVQLGVDDHGHVIMPEEASFIDQDPQTRVIRALRNTLRRRSKSKKQKKVKKNKSKARSNKKTRASLKDLDDLADGVKRTFASVITWYTGKDLLGPSCVQKSKWAPSDKSMIAAVTLDWDNKPACGSWLRLRAKGGKKAIVVRIVDACAGCKAQSAHVDLTKAAFQALYSLDVGLVSDIQAQVLANSPVQDWTDDVISIYGPKDL